MPSICDIFISLGHPHFIFFQDCVLLFMVVVFNLSLLIAFFFYAAVSSVNSLTFLCASFCVEVVGANLPCPFGVVY